MDLKDLEKYSSAITLSDMEIFVFPELMMSLLLANIMSPILWKWRQEESFRKIQDKTPYRKLMRLKQYIMDTFDFNLDLETWGLTHQEVELDRFKAFIDPQEIAKSNALFGYQGDQYYFDVDIRRHFGLDKYDRDVIPYWKTETIEAMEAFRLKENYTKAAGECVSLAALYAAAAFIVCGIPLEDITMILTPLHSQNFIHVQDGILTNNRRLVTKTMWFNGTEISNKAQRALRNEQVTIVAHTSGYIHCLYDKATIDPAAYRLFTARLEDYLATDLNLQIVANFLRTHHDYQKYFQMCRDCHGQARFLKAEVLYHYEHGSNYRIADDTFDKLIAEVSDEDYSPYALPGRIRCDQLHDFLGKNRLDLRRPEHRQTLQEFVAACIPAAAVFVSQLADFIFCRPKLPSPDKQYLTSDSWVLHNDMDRQTIMATLQAQRAHSVTADLAFYAYRDMATCDWRPFIKAAVQRNPVCVDLTASMSMDQVYTWLLGMRDESIYDAQRLAQPDEVANYKTGDGLEKAFVLANVIRQRTPAQDVQIHMEPACTWVRAEEEYSFRSVKGLQKEVQIDASGRLQVT